MVRTLQMRSSCFARDDRRGGCWGTVRRTPTWFGITAVHTVSPPPEQTLQEDLNMVGWRGIRLSFELFVVV